MKYDYIAFTDGSSVPIGNGFNGGAAAIVLDTTAEKIYKQGQSLPGKTNNYSELFGILMALESIKKLKRDGDMVNILIISDSQYAINTIDQWVYKWVKKNGLESPWGKKNEKLIKSIYTKFLCKKAYNINLVHMNSHKTYSETDISTMLGKILEQDYSLSKSVVKLFIKYNREADKICYKYSKNA